MPLVTPPRATLPGMFAAEFSPTQPWPTQRMGSTPTEADASLGFEFRDTATSAQATRPNDPLSSLRGALGAVNDVDNLRDLVHPSDLFEGFENEKAVYTTVRSWLGQIVADRRTHRQLAREDSSICKFVPEPFRKSCTTVSIREKWPAEALS